MNWKISAHTEQNLAIATENFSKEECLSYQFIVLSEIKKLK